MHLVPRTDVPEKKKIWTVSGVLQAGSSGMQNGALFFEILKILRNGYKSTILIFILSSKGNNPKIQ